MTLLESAYHLQLQYFPLCEFQESALKEMGAFKHAHTFRAKTINNCNKNWLTRDRKIGTYRRSSTSLPHIPASITSWIMSFVPSERYEIAQHASVRTFSSLEKTKRSRVGSASLTCPSIF